MIVEQPRKHSVSHDLPVGVHGAPAIDAAKYPDIPNLVHPEVALELKAVRAGYASLAVMYEGVVDINFRPDYLGELDLVILPFLIRRGGTCFRSATRRFFSKFKLLNLSSLWNSKYSWSPSKPLYSCYFLKTLEGS